jgi:hypothetical protein
MKSFIYVYDPHKNKSSNPEKDRISIYRIKHNTPEHLVTVGRGYRSEAQAVIAELVRLRELPANAENCGNFWHLKHTGVANINGVGGQ